MEGNFLDLWREELRDRRNSGVIEDQSVRKLNSKFRDLRATCNTPLSFYASATIIPKNGKYTLPTCTVINPQYFDFSDFSPCEIMWNSDSMKTYENRCKQIIWRMNPMYFWTRSIAKNKLKIILERFSKHNTEINHLGDNVSKETAVAGTKRLRNSTAERESIPDSVKGVVSSTFPPIDLNLSWTA